MYLKVKKVILFRVPSVNIIEEIVYPKQNPLKHIVIYTIDIPITVEPINHKNNASKIKIDMSKKEEKNMTKEDTKIAELNAQLEKAIKEERYEDAAKIRDQIKEMNK